MCEFRGKESTFVQGQNHSAAFAHLNVGKLRVQAEDKQHEEEEDGPRRCVRHLGERLRVHREHQTWTLDELMLQ